MGVGILRGRGIPWFEKNKFQSFKFSKFQSFKVSRFQNSRFQLRGTHIFKVVRFWDYHIVKHIFQMIWDFLRFLKYLGASQITNNWFGESWSRPSGPETIKTLTFRVLQWWNQKVIKPKWSRRILRNPPAPACQGHQGCVIGYSSCLNNYGSCLQLSGYCC